MAKVDGEEITVAEVARLKENYMQMFGGRMSMAQLGGYKRFVEGLIRDRVVAQEAARLGLAASDAEVSDKIASSYRRFRSICRLRTLQTIGTLALRRHRSV